VRPLAGCFVMAPPLIITEAEITELGHRVRASLDRVLANQSMRRMLNPGDVNILIAY
jgi:adenosylmethionine-8-amino-7-oxononanoate aminotransferase